MLTLNHATRRRHARRSAQADVARETAQPVAAPATPPAPPAAPVTNGRTGETINLTQPSQQRNPYEGVAAGFSEVQVGKWGEANGSIEEILVSQGYSRSEIYRKDGEGQTLLDRVSDVNRLRNPNMVRENQSIVVPSKVATEQTQPTEAPVRPEARVQPEQPARAEQPEQPVQPLQPEQPRNDGAAEPAVNRITADRWRKGPNDSLGAILTNQGFTREQIFREDSNGDSLLKKVARANGLRNPDSIQAGRAYDIPNSMEALAQMNIPEMAAEPTTRPPAERIPPQQPTVQVEPLPPVPPTPPVEPPRQEPPVTPNPASENEVTANMGMLLEGVQSGKFSRSEFQYLNARSSRYAQLRARYAKDGYSNEELQQLGQYERRYGIEYARLANGDRDLSQVMADVNDPDLQLQVRHFNESGPLFDNYKNGSSTSEEALTLMIRQREQARQQESN